MLNIIILFLLIIAGIFLFNSSNEEKNIPIKSEIKKETIIVNDENTNKIKILYLDDSKSNISSKETINAKKNVKIVKKESSKQKTIDYSKIDSMDSSQTTNYIEKHNLVNVTQQNKDNDDIPRFSVYSDISEENAIATSDQNIPPMAPVIASGIFKSGQTYTVIIPAIIQQNATKIIVTDNAPDGTPIEAKEIPTQGDINNQSSDDQSDSEMQDNFTITPPSIGQN
jgi:hypothetical protein